MDHNSNNDLRIRNQQQKKTIITTSSLSTSSSSNPISSTGTRWNNNINNKNEEEITYEKRRSGWIDSSKRKPNSRPLSDSSISNDPFAGMNTCINYQKEIERLKTLVPKMESSKKRIPRPKSMGTPPITPTTPTAITDGNCDSKNINSTLTTNISSSSLPINTNNITSSPSNTAHVTSSHSSLISSSFSSPPSSLSSSSSSSSSSLPTSSPTLTNNKISSSTTSNHLTTKEDSSLTSTSSTNLTINTQINQHILDNSTNNIKSSSSPSSPSSDSKNSAITDEEKARFLEFMRSWTGGLHGWNDQKNDHQGLWHSLSSTSRRPHLSTRSEPCSPRHEVFYDPWTHHQQYIQLKSQQQQLLSHPTSPTNYLPSQNQRLSSPPIPLSSMNNIQQQQQQQQQHLYSTPIHHLNYHQHHHNLHLPTNTNSNNNDNNNNNNNNQYHYQQQHQYFSSTMERNGLNHLTTNSIPTIIGTIGDRHSTLSVYNRLTNDHDISRPINNRNTSRNTFGVSVM